jgi:aspartyl-tRNA(Asn)/glutamyl-tRNA(Gln) amidotransferase subunit C
VRFPFFAAIQSRPGDGRDQRVRRSISVAPQASRRYSPDIPFQPVCRSFRMSVDIATVKRVAHLARIAVSEEDAERMTGELNTILGFVEQLNEVDVSGVEPMTSVIPMEMKKRQDVVTDGSKAADIVANAPATDENFFLVPKVVE